MMLSIFVLLLATGIALAEEKNSDLPDSSSDFGNTTCWRKLICEKENDALLKDLDDCLMLEDESYVDASKDCAKEAVPSSNGNIIPFMQEACKDPTKFQKFDDCFDEYQANPAFKQQVETSEEAMECFKKLAEKYKFDFGSESKKKSN